MNTYNFVLWLDARWLHHEHESVDAVHIWCWRYGRIVLNVICFGKEYWQGVNKLGIIFIMSRKDDNGIQEDTTTFIIFRYAHLALFQLNDVEWKQFKLAGLAYNLLFCKKSICWQLISKKTGTTIQRTSFSNFEQLTDWLGSFSWHILFSWNFKYINYSWQSKYNILIKYILLDIHLKTQIFIRGFLLNCVFDMRRSKYKIYDI